MSLLDFRKPPVVVLDECVSYSGKYKGFFGHHYTAGHICYDVGSINQTNGEIIRRHYHKRSYPNPKAEAMAYWHELKKGLVRKPDYVEEADEVKIRKPWEN